LHSNVSWIEPHANRGIPEFGIAAAEILHFKFGARRSTSAGCGRQPDR
jgi:hypothetical protein